MERNSMLILVPVCIALAALIVFLIWKNKKDKKRLNPDAPGAVEQTHMDQERTADKI